MRRLHSMKLSCRTCCSSRPYSNSSSNDSSGSHHMHDGFSRRAGSMVPHCTKNSAAAWCGVVPQESVPQAGCSCLQLVQL
jgi:hypothetical protein